MAGSSYLLITLTLTIILLTLYQPQPTTCLPASYEDRDTQENELDENVNSESSLHHLATRDDVLRRALLRGGLRAWDRVLASVLKGAEKGGVVEIEGGRKLEEFKRGSALSGNRMILSQDDVLRLKRSGMCCSMDMYCFYCGR